jgi:O-antigen/teichoic acid export membrane protein
MDHANQQGSRRMAARPPGLELAMKEESRLAQLHARCAIHFRSAWSLLASQRTMNWAFVDQVMVSGANFATGILLARACGIYEFGRFSLVWLFVEFIGSLQFAAVIQPMLNIGPKQDARSVEAYYHAVAVQQGILCAFFGLVVWGGVTFVGWLFVAPEIVELAVPLCAATITFQLHNFLRRYFFARDRAVVALFNDIIRFAIQIAGTAALLFVWPGSTAVAGLWIIAAACAASIIQGCFYFGRVKWNTTVLVSVSVRHWTFSKWVLPCALMYWMTTQAFVLMAGFVLGAAATGGLRAAVSITGVLNILLLALDNFAPVKAARALHVGGPVELHRYIGSLTLLTGALTMGMVVLINIDPGYLVQLLYGDQFGSIDVLVRWLCVPLVVFAMATPLNIWAAALERTRTIFASYGIATVFTIIAAYPMTLYGELPGIVVGSLLVEAIRGVVLLIPFLQWTRMIGEEKKPEDRVCAAKPPTPEQV